VSDPLKSKCLTQQIAAWQAIDAGKLSLDTPAADILPQLANPIILEDRTKVNADVPYQPAKSPILVRHLLNHSSGLFYPPPPPERAMHMGPAYTLKQSKEDPLGNWFEVYKVNFTFVIG
jgi:CubicO group peptidase (beta-lactamase class C family)